ncbi:MAG: cobalamin B12-binding domain-containing protein [Bryobacteraceae bacterium]|nr:cobalamin B12-binding domain-containing protein [Bryobacteraceae bacterium]
MRILLIYPMANKELIGYGDLGAIAEPLALEYIGAAARQDGHDVRILDQRLHRDSLDETLLDYEPDLVGVTGYSMHVIRMLSICARTKKLLPDCQTVVGGHHATLLPDDFFEPQIDFVVSGEGVGPFRRLLRAIEKKVEPQSIPGLWVGTGGRFVSGGDPETFSIDDLPSPDRTLTKEDRKSYFIDWMKPIALLRTTVGCPYRCSFCSLWKIMDGRYHLRDIERVVQEMASIREECVFLVDDEAFINGKRMKALALALRDAGIKKRYFAYCRIDSLLRQRELMELWRSIGLERLFIGIEATSQKGLVDYNKSVQIAQVEDGLRAAREIGIEVFAGFVVNTNATRDDFKQLIRFIEHNRLSYPSFTILTPIPGTASLTSFDHVTETQPNGRPNWELFDLQHVVTRTLLPQPEFERRYHDLYRVFSERYALYRDDITVVSSAAVLTA